jgi:transketolase
MKTKNIQKIIEAGIDESKSGNFTDALQIPTRKGFGEGLLLAGKDDDRVVALSADLTESTQVESFKKAYPNRYFEMGVAEQNMASVASGMAAMGKIPFITSYAMFSPGRNWEQIRTTIAYNNVPVKIVGCHAGVSVGPDGGTHQALEDVGLMRMISNMIVVVPADAIEAKKATLAIAKNNLPSYLRLFREKSPVITEEDSFFEIGKANIVYKSREGNLPSANFPQKNLA